ncbi:MAG: rhomboid family intramembrane serine protease [Cyclobacteriaceae bacterium]|jgi:membrane associated rhomboid family serine protease
MFNITPLVRNIIFICIAVFIVQRFFSGLYLTERMALYKLGTPFFRPYQLFTYMFAHGGLGHLFFNMMSLAFIGSYLEMVWGFKRFMTYFLVTGIGAAVIYLVLEYYFDPGQGGYMLGASGAIYGILAAFGMMFPEREISLMFPPISVKGKYMVIVLGVFAYMVDVSGQVAHFAHLGGGVVGFILIRFFRF